MGQYKYEPLKNYLAKSKEMTVVLYFDEISRILNSELPACLSGKGYNKKLKWNNSIGNYATRSWLEAGYVFDSFDKDNRIVTFKRNEPEAKRHLGKY
ncbi:MAG: hypothetical protein QM215_04935 [Bacillota bacterium]|jgi:hypothetical protein|nr:hypothetical protein [Bacteroidales bacterium]MDI9492256.1 hypothetical protein [Bacillota bacterium]